MDLTRTLKGYQPGRWVVLNGSMTKVLASGGNAAEAIARSRKKKHKKKDEPVTLLRVPDPTTVCVY